MDVIYSLAGPALCIFMKGVTEAIFSGFKTYKKAGKIALKAIVRVRMQGEKIS